MQVQLLLLIGCLMRCMAWKLGMTRLRWIINVYVIFFCMNFSLHHPFEQLPGKYLVYLCQNLLNEMQEMEAAVVDGNGTETGHVIVTTIGGKNGQPKQVRFWYLICCVDNQVVCSYLPGHICIVIILPHFYDRRQ